MSTFSQRRENAWIQSGSDILLDPKLLDEWTTLTQSSSIALGEIRMFDVLEESEFQRDYCNVSQLQDLGRIVMCMSNQVN